MIRIATWADFPQIVAIYNQSIPSQRATADLTPVTLESMEEWFEAHQKPSRPVYVWDEENTVLGWVSLSDYRSREAYKITTEISIYLDSNAQGKKIGFQLAEHVIEMAPKLGIKNIIAVIFSHNTVSLTLFKKLNFEQWGCLPGVCQMAAEDADIVLLGRKFS